MRRFLSAFLLALALLGASAHPAGPVIHERRGVVSGYIRGSRSDADHVLDLNIVLKQRDSDGLKRVLDEISTPGDSRYGLILSREEVFTSLSLIDCVAQFPIGSGVYPTSRA
jgi:hypothetical protein